MKLILLGLTSLKQVMRKESLLSLAILTIKISLKHGPQPISIISYSGLSGIISP